MMRPSHLAMTLCLPLFASLTVVGCGQDARHEPQSPAMSSGISLNPDTTGSGTEPGTLASATTLPTVDRRLKSATSVAARIEYTSTSGITNSLVQVTGTVFVPNGKPPEGGWPVVAYGHATTGITPDCAPSLSSTLLGASETVAALVKSGYVVTMPDYQGLGGDATYAPFLDSTSAGYDVIDSVRAARRLVPAASDRWVALGISQGGQAAWAANELAANYGAGLALLGTVSLSPPTDLTGFADAASAGQLTKEQQPALQLILAALKNEYPAINLDDYRRGVVADKWDVLSACQAPAGIGRDQAVAEITADDLRPSSPEAAEALRGYLQNMGLPRGPTVAPMQVVYGGLDSYLPSAWTDRALSAACAMGDVIDIQFQPDRGHSDIDASSSFRWISDRFADVPAANSCESFIAAQPLVADPVTEEQPPAEEVVPAEEPLATPGDSEPSVPDPGESGVNP